MMKSHTVQWIRKKRVGSTAYGDPLYANEDGFPIDVQGRFQRSAPNASEGVAGLSDRLDAMFYSDSYTSGKVGDTVEYQGDTYTVFAVTPHTNLFGSTIHHIAYSLQTLKPKV